MKDKVAGIAVLVTAEVSYGGPTLDPTEESRTRICTELLSAFSGAR